MNEKLATRWRLALHESAHFLAALAFGAEAPVAILCAHGEGFTFTGELAPTPAAIMAAAGRAAEGLAAQRDPPPLPAATAHRVQTAAARQAGVI